MSDLNIFEIEIIFIFIRFEFFASVFIPCLKQSHERSATSTSSIVR